MKLLRRMVSLWIFIGVLGGASSSLAADSPNPAAEKAALPAKVAALAKEAPKDIVLKGDAKCTTCHDENDSPEALAIGKTRHGVTADGRTPTCTSCHGDSEAHQKEAGRGDKKPPMPDVTFGAKTKATAQARNEACLSCHQKDSKRHLWEGGAHAAKDVACTSCHQVHTAHDKVRDKRTQPEVCFTCHKEQRAQVNRPSHHPIKEGKVVCSDCHNVHGTAGPKLLKRDTVNDTCYSCHMEKRGPFLHNHQPVLEDCGLCHNPHGTTVAAMLKSRPPFLCQQCHNDVSNGHPGQIGALPASPTTSTSSLGSVGRGCLNCHTSIHGDNNPQGATATRRFFR